MDTPPPTPSCDTPRPACTRTQRQRKATSAEWQPSRRGTLRRPGCRRSMWGSRKSSAKVGASRLAVFCGRSGASA